jgi:sulfite exporter TauE/SafE
MILPTPAAVALATSANVFPHPVALGLFFVIGLFGAAHCLGMCGPLVSLYADRLNSRTPGDEPAPLWYTLRQHLLFNLGRTTIYALLGGLFGLLGGAVFASTDLAVPFGDEVRGLAGLLVGLLVVLAGLSYAFGWRNRVLSGEFPLFGPAFRRIHDQVVERMDHLVGGPRIYVLGFAHGFLPCPLLYPAFLYALGRGDPIEGAVALAALGAGTVPAVFLYGTLYQSSDLRHHVLAHRLLGGAFALLGLHTVLMGIGLLGLGVPEPFGWPIYQPLGGADVGRIPVLVALPVAGFGSLFLLGAALLSLYRRRSLSYLLVTLAILLFATRIAVSQLAFLGHLGESTSMTVSYLSDAGITALIVAAIYYVSKARHPPGTGATDDTPRDPPTEDPSADETTQVTPTDVPTDDSPTDAPTGDPPPKTTTGNPPSDLGADDPSEGDHDRPAIGDGGQMR